MARCDEVLPSGDLDPVYLHLDQIAYPGGPGPGDLQPPGTGDSWSLGIPDPGTPGPQGSVPGPGAGEQWMQALDPGAWGEGTVDAGPGPPG